MALYGMVKIWFTRGMKETPEEVVHNISLLTRDHMYSTFEQMDRENRTAGGGESLQDSRIRGTRSAQVL